MLKNRIRTIEKKLHHQKRNILVIIPNSNGSVNYTLNGKQVDELAAAAIMADPLHNDIYEVVFNEPLQK